MLAHNQNFAIVRGLKSPQQVSIGRRIEQTSATQTYHRQGTGGRFLSRRRLCGSGGEAPSCWTVFLIFLEKLVILIPLDHNYLCLEPFERPRFCNIWKPIKKDKLFNPPFTYNKSKTRLKFCNLGLKFVSDSAQVGESKVLCFVQYFSSK